MVVVMIIHRTLSSLVGGDRGATHVKRSIAGLCCANTSAWFHWSPRFPDWDQIVVHVVPDAPGAPLSRIADPMVEPYMWYWKEMPLTNAPPPTVFARSKFLLLLKLVSAYT